MNWINKNWIMIIIMVIISAILFLCIYFFIRDSFSKDYTNYTNETLNILSSTSSSESSSLDEEIRYSDSSFDFNKYLENNTVETIITTDNVLGYKIELITKEDSHGIVLITKFSISKNNKLLYETEDQKFSPIFSEFSYENNEQWRFLETAEDFINFALRDITNNGTPEFVFYGWSGGAHCCHTAHIIELTDPLSLLWNFNMEDYGVNLVDINKDGIVELKTNDASFNYWNTSFVTSPAPEIRLKLDVKNKKYIVDVDTMRKVTPSQKDIESKAKNWSEDGWNGYGEYCVNWTNETISCFVPWGYALDLLYSGNLESAKTYIDLAWRDNNQFKSKDIFWNELKKQIKESNFYTNISPSLIDLTKLP